MYAEAFLSKASCMDNKPVLYWTPSVEPTTFGVGGEVSESPLCQCGAPMTHVGIFPQGSRIWQLFYCFQCCLSEGACLSASFEHHQNQDDSPHDQKETKTFPMFEGACLKEITPQQHQEILKELEHSVEIPFVSYESTALCMSHAPAFGQVPVGEGVYTMGISPIPLPCCPKCSSQMPLFIHIDSLAHEDLHWEGLSSMLVFKCPRHEEAVFKINP